ncbi:patatin-like phospholipase family protein [Cognatilysobacter segetis]|uniref:patatin-like phospholipase family protein n=1 Tax=Cognatilysobacter segetis TaxID=2492394 RepID=UPI00105B7BBB|nr:patatin-like phospholipase family protein [Lysobacter segetis]
MTPAANEPVALVLGAGGARGLAQIGVIEVLEQRGFRIAAVAGSSIGALIGGLYAAGKLADYRDWLTPLERSDILRLLDPAFSAPALFRGQRILDEMRRIAGSPRIEDLPVPLTVVAVDLMRQREVWLREGDLWDAVRGSMAIPGVFTPHVVRGRELVDGGILAPLPITATRLSGAHRLVAVDMHSWPAHPPGALAQPAPSEIAGEMPSLFGRWLRRFGDRVDGADARAMGFTELMARSLDTMQAQIARVQMALDPPEIVIRIPRDACQFYEFWRARELVELGRRCASQTLDAAGY